MKRKMYPVVLFLLGLLAWLPSARATSYTWRSTASNHLWADSANWNPSGVPSANDDVTINTAPSNYPVLDADRSIQGFTMTMGTLDLAGFRLTANGVAAVSGGQVNNGKILLHGATTTLSGAVFGAEVEPTSFEEEFRFFGMVEWTYTKDFVFRAESGYRDTVDANFYGRPTKTITWHDHWDVFDKTKILIGFSLAHWNGYSTRAGYVVASVNHPLPDAWVIPARLLDFSS